MDLFIKTELPKVALTKEARKFYKIAEEFKLDDDPDKWQMQIASTLYNQAPYLDDYAVDVNLDKVEGDKGFAFGQATIKNKFQDPKLNKEKSKDIKIPIIVKNKMLKPFDIVIVGGQAFPLSDQMLKELLFRPSNVELTEQQPARDKYIGNQNFAPYPGAYGGFGGMGGFAGNSLGKYASLLSELEIDSSLKKEIGQLVESIKEASLKNRSFIGALQKIAASKKAFVLEPFTTIQLKKLANKKIKIKLANNIGEEQEAIVPESQAAALTKLDVQSIEDDGTITVSTNAAQKKTTEDDEYKSVEEFGEYKVQDIEDTDLLGWVLPLHSFKNQPLPVYLFTNGSCWAYQEKISGSKVGMGNNLPKHTPSGFGFFYSAKDGKIQAFEPVEVGTSSGTQLQCSSMDGQPLTLELTEVDAPTPMGENAFALPKWFSFMSLSGEQTNLKESGAEIQKIAELRAYENFVELSKFGHDLYAIRGDFNKENLDRDEAEFYLTHLGFDGSEKLSEIDLPGRYKMKLAGAFIPKKEKIAAKQELTLPKLPLENIVKIASTFQDEDTVDKILSLGVINPDNVHKFIAYLPAFIDIQGKLSDLLFASRCGLNPVPEENVQLGLGHVSKVIEGLKNLKERESL